MANPNESVDLDAIDKKLSESYSTILQYATLSEDVIRLHLSQLAQYREYLPLSWFTPVLLDALSKLGDRYHKENNFTNQGFIYSLWTMWVRRLASSPEAVKNAEPRLSQTLERMGDNVALLTPTGATLPLIKEACMGIVSLAGRAPTDFSDKRIVQTLARVIERCASEPDIGGGMIDYIGACVTHCLTHTTILNVFEAEDCEKLMEAYVGFIAQNINSGIPSAMNVMEMVVDARSNLKPQSRAEADLDTLVGLAKTTASLPKKSIPASFAQLAILAGVLRMLFFVNWEKAKKLRSLQQDTEALFAELFNQLIKETIKTDNAYSFVSNQDHLGYIAGQCLSEISNDTIASWDVKDLLRILVSCLLTSENVWKNGATIQSLSTTPECVQALNQHTTNPMYKEISRLTRAIGKTMRVALESGDAANVNAVQLNMDRLVGFSYNVYIDWDRFQLREQTKSHSDTAQKDLNTAVWLYFKTMIFSYLAILKPVVLDLADGQGLARVPSVAQDVLSIFANFHFITDHLGMEALSDVYKDVLTNAVAFLSLEDHKCQLNKFLSLAYQEYAPPQFTADTTHPTALLSPVQASRLLFFTDLIEHAMPYIEDNVLERDILPVIYPMLKQNYASNKNLYESAHAAVLAVFAAKKPVARELGGVYAKILIESFPTTMVLDQLKFGFTSLIQGLCQTDDAMAWIATGYLLDKIKQLDKDKDAVLRSQYTAVAINLIKPLSLGPFYRQMLDQVEKLVLEQETAQMRKSTLKIIFETVSGPGLSDMRRFETVGWYNQLKHKLEGIKDKVPSQPTTTSSSTPSATR